MYIVISSHRLLCLGAESFADRTLKLCKNTRAHNLVISETECPRSPAIDTSGTTPKSESALMIYTSGTTGRPKVSVCGSLELRPQLDICLDNRLCTNESSITVGRVGGGEGGGRVVRAAK